MGLHTVYAYASGAIPFYLKSILILGILLFCSISKAQGSTEAEEPDEFVKEAQLLLEQSLIPRKDLSYLTNKPFETLRPETIPNCTGFGRVFLPMPSTAKIKSTNYFYVECYSADLSTSGPVLEIKKWTITNIYSKKEKFTLNMFSVGEYPVLINTPSYLAGSYDDVDYQFETKKYTLNTKCIFGDILRVQSPNKTIDFNTDFILLQKIDFGYEYEYYPNCPGLVADRWTSSDRRGLINYIDPGDILKIGGANYLINDTFILALDSEFKPKNKEINIRKIFVKDLMSAGLLGYLTNSTPDKLPSSVVDGLSRLSVVYNRAAR